MTQRTAPTSGEALDERTSLIGLAHCVEPSDPVLGACVAREGPVGVLDRILRQDERLRHVEGLAARLAASPWRDAEDRAAARGARLITRVDREWPSQFGDLADAAPFALWVTGAANLRLIALRSVSIVGARACTAYGEEVARTWASQLASESWCVVSGGAFGIDAAAHRGALAAEGVTICVLAGGVDVPYPRAHDALIARIGDEGLVVSETPLGESVRRQRFLSRNRLIAAISRATVVVEAAERSGTLATARAATGMRRPVLAVPGPVSSAASAGCHRMIRDGEAMIVDSADEVLALLDLSRVASDPTDDAQRRPTAEESRVLDALPARAARSVGDLLAATGLPSMTILSSLGALQVQGWVVSDHGGWRLVRR
jgi:DNA processing protein